MSGWGEYMVKNGTKLMLLCDACRLYRENKGQVLIRLSAPEGPHFDCFDCGRTMTHAEVLR